MRKTLTTIEWHKISHEKDEIGNSFWMGWLPDEENPVLVTTSEGFVMVDELIGDENSVWFDNCVFDVIAWAEFPDPYREEEP